MSNLDLRTEQTAKSEEDLSLPAFKIMGQGYKFVFTRLLVFIRLGWLDFVYSAILFVGTGFAQDILGPRAQTGAFQVVLLPLMGFFVLRFAVRCHRYAYRE